MGRGPPPDGDGAPDAGGSANTPWGAECRLAAEDQFRRTRSSRHFSPVERQVAAILAQHESQARQTVERTFKQWNHVVRDQLRTETGLRLSIGDDVRAVPVHVVDGLPRRFSDAIEGSMPLLWLLLNRPSIDAATEGLATVERQYPKFEAAGVLPPNPPSPEQVKEVHRLLMALSQRLGEDEFLQRLSRVDEDVFGAYFFRSPEVQLYWMALVIGAAVLGVPLEALTLVVVIHELAHAYSHLGRDIDGGRWRTEDFARADVSIVEGLAQFYTETVCRKIVMRQPAALIAFEALLKVQAPPYREHREWVDAGAQGGEVVRVSMIEGRVRGMTDRRDFSDVITRHRKQFGAGG
jgi:hypothetical protein